MSFPVKNFYSKMKMKVVRSCLTLCDPMDYTVHRTLQASMLKWVAIPFSRGLPNSGIKPVSLKSPALTDGFFTTSATF